MALVKRFSIGKKVSVGYIIIILITTLCSFYSVLKLRESRNTDEKISEVFTALLVKMDQMQVMVSNSKKYINNWIYVPNDAEKEALRLIQDEEFPQLVKEIKTLQSKWTRDNSLDSLDLMIEKFYQNVSYQQQIMQNLNTIDSYNYDSLIFYVAIPIFDEQVEPRIDALSNKLSHFTAGLQTISDDLIAEKNASLDRVENITILLTILSIILGAVCSYIVTSSIAKPIRLLNENIQRMGQGELPKFDFKTSSDEVGDMTRSLDHLRENLENTSNFARNIGNGMLEVEYEALSEQDVLGKSLLAMRDNLLEVISETREVVSQAGANGDLKARIDLGEKAGAWKELSSSINNLLLSIATPVLAVNRLVNAMAIGNLTERLTDDVKGDFRNLFDNLNKALDTLNDFLGQIADNAVAMNSSSEEMQVTSHEMASSTSEIAAAIGQMSSGAQTQVGKVDESSQLIEGILSSSSEMGQKAERINSAAKVGVDNSEEGTKMVEKVVTNMTEIAEYSDKTNQSMTVLTDRSNQITKMLAVISEIAAQTNLLALNAAIEAAQAGDAGRGFAVVAEEIRKLAESSRSSAKEIEMLVLGVQSDTKDAAKVIETMHESVIAGNKTSLQVSEAFKKITEASHKTLDSSEEILDAAQNQIRDINNVVNITEGIVVIAEQTASGTEEVAASASELSSGMDNYNLRAQELSKIANKLKSGVEKFSLSETQSSENEEILSDHGGQDHESSDEIEARFDSSEAILDTY
ncbi:MAG: methyl-accepting chemotaxis protein [Reichenbachiella sp.]|uniref:methyl-accepting chemotaxis protein n=1 Tax=Reichenbachiella sp. TaxID=2184521 RepID=UPI003264B934